MKKFTKATTIFTVITFLLLTFIPVINLSVNASSLSQILIDNYINIRDCKDGMIAVQKDNKYGFINKNGKVVVPLIYDSVGDFNESVASVVIGDKMGFIDKTGKVIIPIQYDVRTTRSMYSWADNCNESMIAVSLNGKWGYFDKTGKAILPLQYDYIRPFSEGFAAIGIENKDVKFNGDITHEYLSSYIKWGYIDKTGKIVIPMQYGNTAFTELGHYANDFKNGYVRVYDIKNKKTKYIDKTGKESVFDFDEYMGQNLYLKKTDDDNYIIIDNTGKQIIKDKFQSVSLFENGYICIGKYDKKTDNWKYGIIDKTGKTIIPLEYDFIYEKENYFIVTKKEKIGVIDDTKKIVVPIEYDSMESIIDYKENMFIVSHWNSVLAVYTLNRKVSFDYKEVNYLGDNLFIVSNEKGEGIVDINKKIILPLGSHTISRKINESLIIITDTSTSSNNVYCIDTKGKVVIPANYSSIWSIGEGLLKAEITDSNYNKKTYIIKNPLLNEK